MPEPGFDDDDHDRGLIGTEHRERWRNVENIHEGTPAEKRRHHFVPRMWIRNWGDPQTERVEVIDILSGEGFRTAPTNVMLVNDLYRIGTEATPGHDMGPEEAFSKIEGAGAASMGAVLAGLGLEDEQRYDLALVVALQHYRVPEAVAAAVPEDPLGVKPALEAAAAALLAMPDGPPPPGLRANARGLSAHELARELVDGFPEFAAVERGFGFWNLLDATHHLAGRIYRRQWTIARTESILLLGDDPVSVRPLGGVTFKAGVVTTVVDSPVPIGPHTLLLIGNRPDGAGTVEQTEQYAAISNEIQMIRASRFLIGPPVGS